MSELTIADFSFTGRLGSQGARIDRVGRNHFHIELGTAPDHPEWFNLLQFEIPRNAKGNRLRLDVSFEPRGETADSIRFNHDANTWSYDGRNWVGIEWKNGNGKNGRGSADTLEFPEFTQDRVVFGAQVPMAYEDVVAFMERYGRHPDARVHVIGQSLAGRNIYRLEITDRSSPQSSNHPIIQSPSPPLSRRWGFHVNQQHSGEHHGKWRMIGMIDWLLSDAGEDFRRRSVWHFVLEMNPDAPSNGWYRVNAQGVDLNRAYLMTGADAARQAHESYVLQKDFDVLMASETPITACWSMHTWPGDAHPVMYPGPEVGVRVGSAVELCEIMDRLDTRGLIKPLDVQGERTGVSACWHDGPHLQYGITAFLCEGSDFWTDKDMSLEVGRVFVRAMAEFYAGCRPAGCEQ